MIRPDAEADRIPDCSLFFFFFFVPGQSSEILHRKPKIQLLARRKWNFISVVAAYILSGRVYRKSAGDQEFPVEKMLWPK